MSCNVYHAMPVTSLLPHLILLLSLSLLPYQAFIPFRPAPLLPATSCCWQTGSSAYVSLACSVRVMNDVSPDNKTWAGRARARAAAAWRHGGAKTRSMAEKEKEKGKRLVCILPRMVNRQGQTWHGGNLGRTMNIPFRQRFFSLGSFILL